MNRNYALLFSILFTLLLFRAPAGAQDLVTRNVATGLNVPWEIIWGPDGWIWYTERPGKVSRVNPETGEKQLLLTVPDVYAVGESGLLGMALHPDFADSGYVYLVYTYQAGGNPSIRERMVRYRYNGTALVNPRTLVDNIPGNATHDGSRLVITPDRKIIMTLGDAQIQNTVQSHTSINGKIIRLNLDGSIPADNPYANAPAPANHIWTTGHRNPQGLVYANGILYSSEHGPDNNDEINIIEKKGNYGWPIVHGPCDQQTEQIFCDDSSVVEPIVWWSPTIAVAGMDYYDHPVIPEWRGSLLVTTLKNANLLSLKLSDDKRSVVSQKVHYDKTFGRLRDICIAPDGRVFICTSNRDGRGNPGTNDDRIIELKSKNAPPPPVSIAAPTPDMNSYRAGGAIEASFTVEGEFEQGNIFTLQLSDRNGSFNAPTALAALVGPQAGSVNGMLSCELSGGDYRLRVVSSAPVSVGSESTIPISAKPQVLIESGGPTTFCEGGSVALDASPGFVHYTWSTGTTGPSISVSTSGTYSVLSIDSSSCTDTASIVISVIQKPSQPLITGDGMVLTSSAPTGNQWYRNGEPIPGATGRTYTVVENGTYTVSATNECGSTTSEGVQRTVSSVPGEGPSAPGMILLYPHPVKERLTLELTLPRGGDVETVVTDVTGREVMRLGDEGAPGLYRRELQVEGLAPGVYHLRAVSGSREWIGKFVKE